MGLFKKKESISYIAVYFPTSGRPVEVEVQLEENGIVTHDGKSWVVTPNSSWVDTKGKRRIVLPEGIATTFDGATVAGKSTLTARGFFLFVKNALLEQIYRIQNQKPWFKQSSTWIIAGALALVALMLAWNVLEMGGGFDKMAEGLQGLEIQSNTPTEPQGSQGHQPIQQRA